MRIALRRAASSHLFVWLVVLVAGAAVAGAALTGFSAETRGQATYAGGWLSPPSALQTPSPLGYGARLSWTAGTHGMSGGGATQALLGSQFSSNPTSCTSATYADFSTTGLSATLATTWDNRGSTLNGYWICYRLESRRATWSSGANFSLVQIGLVPAGIAPANGGSNANTTENNDTITLTFNQPITYTGAASINVCVFGGGSGTGSIVIGPSSCSSSSNTGTIGKVSGLTVTSNRTYPTSAVAVVSGNTKQLRVTLGGASNSNLGRTAVASTGSTAFAYTGSTSLITSVADVPNGIAAANLCTVTARCPWTYSGGF